MEQLDRVVFPNIFTSAFDSWRTEVRHTTLNPCSLTSSCLRILCSTFASQLDQNRRRLEVPQLLLSLLLSSFGQTSDHRSGNLVKQSPNRK